MKAFVLQPVFINVPVGKNVFLEKILDRVNKNRELNTLWKINNVNAISRLGYSDHGYTHFQIVANSALRISRILVKKGVVMSLVEDYGFENDYSEGVIFLASVMHDIGMSVNREGHEELSLFIARDLLKEILDFMSVEERTVVMSEVLHAILSHRSSGNPITVEAGIVRVADALDMANGRSRIPFESGQVNIHSVSAYAIDSVSIKEGEKKAVQIDILMNNSSGLFQIDELLKEKMRNSGISKYFEIAATMKGETERSLIKEFSVDI
jgi:metal-dependent HD superfamily phosphatase/phosphodiesterase